MRAALSTAVQRARRETELVRCALRPMSDTARCRRSISAVSAAKARAGRPLRFTEAVGAAHRLPCGARSRGPSPNSLRSLRSLRSNNRDESVVDARCARGHEPWPCRPRRAGRHGRSQGTSGPPDRLCPCSPPRRLRGAARPARTHLCGSDEGVRPVRHQRWISRQAYAGSGQPRRATTGPKADTAVHTDVLCVAEDARRQGPLT